MAQRTTHSAAERASIYGLAFGVLVVVLGVAFAAGWLFGRIVL